MTGRDWMGEANCATTSPDAFFPEIGQSTDRAYRVCNVCDVAAECLAYALANGFEDGIWGNRSPNQRRALRRGAA